MTNSIGGNIVDIHTKSIYPCEVLIQKGRIIEIIKNNKTYHQFIIPGFVDSHIHVESSLLIPSGFAEVALTHGTIAAVSDPHEIANVCGLKGIEFMIENGNSVPFYFSFGVPSSVPSTKFESNGAIIAAPQIRYLFEKFNLSYLSEVMNYPNVISGDESTISKIEIAKFFGKKVDGHAPDLTGLNLAKYAEYGIETDHECSTLNEAIEKINLGFKILIREGSAARNFDSLASLVDLFPNQVMLCTDDCHPDILIKYHINDLIRRGLQKGLNLFNLLRAASLNPIVHYNIPAGLLRVNDSADFTIIDDLENFNVLQTWIKGKPIFDFGDIHLKSKRIKKINNFYAKPISLDMLSVIAKSNAIRVINLKEDSLITQQSIENIKIINGKVVPDIVNDILKLVVINRYSEKSIPAIGFVKNFGMKYGAIASSISHDSHNIIAVGTNDNDLCSAINLIINNKGGLVASKDGISTFLELEIAGLMTRQPARKVVEQLSRLNDLAKEYGCTLKAPYMSLSFLSLIVIPHLKLSDQGLFNVDSFSFTELFID